MKALVYSETPAHPGQEPTRWRLEARTREEPPRTFRLGEYDSETVPQVKLAEMLPSDVQFSVVVTPLYAHAAEPVDEGGLL